MLLELHMTLAGYRRQHVRESAGRCALHLLQRENITNCLCEFPLLSYFRKRPRCYALILEDVHLFELREGIERGKKVARVAEDLVDSNLDRQPGFAQGPAKAFANEALDKLENMPEQRAEGAIIGMTTISNPAVPNQPASEHRHGVAVARSCMPA